MNSNSAKQRAVSKTIKLVCFAFFAAFVFVFCVNRLLTLVDNNVSKGTEISINFLLTFSFLGFSLWFSRENIGNAVIEAIDIAAKELAEQERKEISDQNIKRIQEYSCAIPRPTRSNKIEFSLPSNVCINRVARDAVVKALADEDDLLREIASASIQYALNQLDRDINQTDNELFIDDIYAYLKAWLMFSIRYERNMPIEYIRQRYRKNRLPDLEAYRIAIEKVRDRVIGSVLEERLDKRLTASQRDRAIRLTVDLLTELSSALGNNHSNN